MYEEYLETFVFKTAKFIAMKLFGRMRKPKNESDRKEPEAKIEDENAPKEEKDLKNEKSLISSNKNPSPEENEAVEKMLDDLMKRQHDEKLKQEKDPSRLEYNSLADGLDEINFHFPLFFLLIVITLLGMPSSITWAKNYHYSKILTPDPFRIPATICLISLGCLWQLNTPRNM